MRTTVQDGTWLGNVFPSQWKLPEPSPAQQINKSVHLPLFREQLRPSLSHSSLPSAEAPVKTLLMYFCSLDLIPCLLSPSQKFPSPVSIKLCTEHRARPCAIWLPMAMTLSFPVIPLSCHPTFTRQTQACLLPFSPQNMPETFPSSEILPLMLIGAFCLVGWGQHVPLFLSYMATDGASTSTGYLFSLSFKMQPGGG